MIDKESLVEIIKSQLQLSEHIATVGFNHEDEYEYVAIQIVEIIDKLGVLNFTENENGGKKDGQMAASR